MKNTKSYNYLHGYVKVSITPCYVPNSPNTIKFFVELILEAKNRKFRYYSDYFDNSIPELIAMYDNSDNKMSLEAIQNLFGEKLNLGSFLLKIFELGKEASREELNVSWIKLF